ncbi:phage holin family protein [uncultured Clostridium sp.]|uniref:phage holin family protein n=1 Tax=uncultured Clostridium sp. TaxID=59620 RepID=UPI0026050E04|nr:phage holin family protein [uncultured Clostridium sp.]
MENKSKILTTGILGGLSAKLGILVPILMLLIFAMIIDYTTGMLAAKYEGVIQSRRGMWGIVKKLLYGVAVAVALMVDWTIVNVAGALGIVIPITVFFSVIVAIWFVINECISILENLIKMEVELPDFLQKIAINFKVAVEKKGNKMAENIKLKDD